MFLQKIMQDMQRLKDIKLKFDSFRNENFDLIYKTVTAGLCIYVRNYAFFNLYPCKN